MRIGIVAGETSGDLLGCELIRAIKRRNSNAVFEGVTGPKMEAAGCKKLFSAESLAVMGIVEVFAHFKKILAIRKHLVQHFLSQPPDVFIGIDAPDFNLGLESKLKQAGIPTVHYVSPSVWAWRQYRVKKIARSVSLMLTLFPFEEKFYQEYAVPVQYVGHPLADKISSKISSKKNSELVRQQLKLPIEKKIIGILPGSRTTELNYLAEAFIQTAYWCTQQQSNLHFVVPLATPKIKELFAQILRLSKCTVPITLLSGQSHEAIMASDVVLLASGTATLETLLLKTPMVVAYRVSPLTAFIGRRLIKISRFSLPNLLADDDLVEEFIQEQVVPEKMGKILLGYINNPQSSASLIKRFEVIAKNLQKNASDNAAEAILQMVSTCS